MNRLSRLFLGGTLLFIGRGDIGAQTIDFESLACSTSAVSYPSLTFGAYRFTSSGAVEGGFRVLCSNYPDARVAGSTAVYNYVADNITTLSRLDAGAFSIASIDLTPYYFYLTGHDVTFTAELFGGGTVQQTFSLPSVATAESWSTYTFSSAFGNVTSVSWAETFPYHRFDNVVVGPMTTVPEPTSGILAIAAGLILCVMRRRQDRRAVSS